LVTGRLQVSPRIWSDVLKSTPILAPGNYQWQWNMRTLFFSKGGCLPNDILPQKTNTSPENQCLEDEHEIFFETGAFCGHVNFCGGVYTIQQLCSVAPIRCRGSRRPMKPFKWPKVLESYRPQRRERGGCRNYGEDLLRKKSILFLVYVEHDN